MSATTETTPESDPPRARAPAGPQLWLRAAGEAVGIIAGVVALVYILGGLVYALRLAFDSFAVEAIVALIGQLPRESVVTAGSSRGLGRHCWWDYWPRSATARRTAEAARRIGRPEQQWPLVARESAAELARRSGAATRGPSQTTDGYNPRLVLRP